MPGYQRLLLRLAFIIIALATALLRCEPAIAASPAKSSAPRVITGEVKDALGKPIPNVLLTLKASNGRTAAQSTADANGRFSFSGVQPGIYLVAAQKERYQVATQMVNVPANASVTRLTLTMESLKPLTVAVNASRLNRGANILSATGNSAYTLTEKEISGLPEGQDTPINQVLLQMPGVVQDEDGQVHVRGAHADLQWRINGVMLPFDTFSGFGQVLSSYFIRSISLVDGALPAQYGFRNSGILDIQTKDGCAQPGGNLELFGGQRETAKPNFEYGGCNGNLSYYTTGFFLHSDLGLSQATPAPAPIHDGTNQGQGFGYFSYFLNPTTRLSLITGISVQDNQFPNWPFQVPQYSLAGVNPAAYPSTILDESLFQQYYFAILTLQGTLGTSFDYQIAFTTKYNTIHFSPDPVGDLIYEGVASNEFHQEIANSLQADFTYRYNKAHTLGFGFYVGQYSDTFQDTSLTFPANSAGQQTSDVPVSISNNFNSLNWLFGVYGQDTWRISEQWSLIYGLRWDEMLASFGSGNQLSPRVNLVWEATKDTTFHAGVARFFETPSFYTISPLSFTSFANTTAAVQPGVLTPKPERDWYFDVGAVHNLAPGLQLEEDTYYEFAHDVLDLGQFGFVPIFIPFNYFTGRVYGSESTVTYRVGKNFTMGTNFTAAIAQGENVVTGQFNFTPQELAYAQNNYIYLDHQQFYTASGWANYVWGPYLFSIDGLYGSGLRSGFANTAQVPWNWQINLGIARTFMMPEIGPATMRVALINIFDRTNLLRTGSGVGIFAPAYGPRFAAYAGLSIPLGERRQNP
jgi:outer membrane receptor protein involved in Fe transport